MPPPKIQELDTGEEVVDLVTSLEKLDTFSESKRERQSHAKAAIEELDETPTPKTPGTADDVLLMLKEKPNAEKLSLALRFLAEGIRGKHDFSLKESNAKAAQIINVLVTIIIPDYWSNINFASTSTTGFEIKQLLLQSLRSVAGIGAVVASLRNIWRSSNDERQVLLAKDTIAFLAQLLAPEFLIHTVLKHVTESKNEAQCHMLWQEFISMIAGGKVLSTTSQAVFVTKCLDHDKDEDAWVADGREYASWLGKNLDFALINTKASDTKHWTMISQMVKRCITLAHPDLFVAQIVDGLIMRQQVMWKSLQLLFDHLARAERERLFKLILDHAIRKYLSQTAQPQQNRADRSRVGGVAAIVAGLIDFEFKTRPEERFEIYMVNWICSNDGDISSYGVEGRRAMIAALADKHDSLRKILEKNLRAFSDKLHIQHTPILQQEALAQTILLTAGYLCRQDLESARSLLRSSFFFQAVSNRLAASLPRARVLGMIVGTAISRLLDSPEKAMRFDVDELDISGAKALMDLVHCEDVIGSLQELKEGKQILPTTLPKKRKAEKSKPKQKPAPLPQSKIVAIEELSDSDEAEDLVPYQKPDEDAEDSDDDPTLINRSKPMAPVYIKDLITALQASDSPDTIDLALKTAPSLIRRKASFGTELSENIDRLAGAVINLKEGLDKPANRTLQLQAMIACLVSQPSKMAPWFIGLYFEGDLSQAQQATVLTAIGLSARELGGYTDAALTADDTPTARSQDFPSQRLPPNLAAAYDDDDRRSSAVGGGGDALSHVARQIEHSTLRPMALEAADQMSGPNALKIRTFSSRMEVDRRREAKQRERRTRIPKDLHRLLAETFFMELCGRLGLILSSSKLLSLSLLSPSLFRLALQTLLIILDTLGPHVLQLPAVTRETLLLLTTLHTHPTLSLDAHVLPTALSVLLQVLELNIAAGPVAEERLVTEFGVGVAELVAWVGGLDDGGGVGSRDGEDEEGGQMPWQAVAAGVQVKWAEVGRKFQGRMLGLGVLGDQRY